MTSLALNTTASYKPSEGLWQLAWKRLWADKVAIVAMAIVALMIFMSVLSFFGLIASKWQDETGINYAPPTFAPKSGGVSLEEAAKQANQGESVGSGQDSGPTTEYVSTYKDPLEDELKEIYKQLGRPIPGAKAAAGEGEAIINPADPLADDLREIYKQLGRPIAGEASAVGSGIASWAENPLDPLAEDMKAIKTELLAGSAVAKPKAIVRAETLPFGGDKWGRDVLSKVIKGSETSILVGISAAILATVLGTLLGAVSGYFGGWVDDVLNWFYSIFNSIPYLLLILAVAAVLNKKGVLTVVLILGLTGWASIYRLVRAEYLKHKTREYVQASDAIGASHTRKMFVHIFPNISHVVLVQLSLHVVLFIKSEVILSFLGFGVPVDTVSWGSMLSEAQSELILGKWWQLAAATLFMAILVTAFSLFTDALRDALDPKLK